MIHIKTENEIDLMRFPAEIAKNTLKLIVDEIKSGNYNCEDLDALAEQYINKNSAKAAFKHYRPPFHHLEYQYTLCLSINHEIVHGMPKGKIIKNNDIVSIDVGVEKNGWFADTATTIVVGDNPSLSKRHLVERTEQALFKGIDSIKENGINIRGLTYAIQRFVESYGYNMCRNLSGHGIGKNIHELPNIPNHSSGLGDNESYLIPGMVFCVEPMVTTGNGNILQNADGWTIQTADKHPSAHFEHVVAITKKGVEILTK